MREFFMGLFGDGMAAQYGTALWDTLKITLLSTILAYIIGVPLGILLYGTAKDSIFPIFPASAIFFRQERSSLRETPVSSRSKWDSTNRSRVATLSASIAPSFSMEAVTIW